MELSKRLKTVADAVTPGKRVADIGTDHGFVPIFLVKNNICPEAVAMDINKGPLERAKEHIEEENLSDKIITRLSDGLCQLLPEETDCIIMAGMGGELICRILKKCPVFTKEGKELILQPQSEWNKVRRYLDEISYRIEKEWFLEEDGKYYVIIKALPQTSSENQNAKPKDKDTENPDALSQDFLYEYGAYLLEGRNPVLMEYLSKKLMKKRTIAKKIEAVSVKNEQTTKRLKEIYNEINEIEKIIKMA